MLSWFLIVGILNVFCASKKDTLLRLAGRSSSERREMLKGTYLGGDYGKYCMEFSLYTGDGNQ